MSESSSLDNKPKSSPHFMVLIGALMLVGAVLRLIDANTCLWIDEINCLKSAIRPPLAEVLTTFQGDIQHPFYCVLANITISALGESPWVVRLPAIIFGVITIPLIYRVALVYGSKIEALMVAGLVTFSYHHVWFSQNARGYTALLFFTLLGTLMLYRGIIENRNRYFVWFSIAAAFGSYTHLSMAMVIVGLGIAAYIYVLTVGRKEHLDRWLKIGWSLCLGGVLTIVLYTPMVTEIIRFFGEPSVMEGTSTPLWALLEAIKAFQFGSRGPIAWIALAVLAVGMIVVMGGVWDLWKRQPLFLLLITVPVIFTGLAIVMTRGTLYPRYVFFGLGFGVMIGVRGVMLTGAIIAKRLKQQPSTDEFGLKLGAAMMLLVIAVSGVTVLRNYQSPKQDFAGGLRYIEDHIQPGDQVLTVGAARWAYLDYYQKPWTLVETVDDLNQELDNDQRTWIVYTFQSYIDREIVDTIRDRTELQKKLPATLGNGEVYVYLGQPK